MDMTKQALADLVGVSVTTLKTADFSRQKAGKSPLFMAGKDPKKCDLAYFVRAWAEYRAEQEAAHAGTDMTKQALAELTGKTYRQIYNINKALAEEDEEKALFVKGEDAKKCDLAVFVRRWVDYNVECAQSASGDLDAVRAQHESVKMRKTQLEVDRMEGTLVDVQEVRKIWGDIANTIMQNMIHLPSTLAPMVRGMENVEVISNVIDTEIRKVLEGLAETPLPAYLLLQEEDEEEE